jgi:hypothetical protein
MAAAVNSNALMVITLKVLMHRPQFLSLSLCFRSSTMETQLQRADAALRKSAELIEQEATGMRSIQNLRQIS